MELSSIILRVEDLGRSVAFWRDVVGFNVASQGPGFASVDSGRVPILLAPTGSAVSDESMTEIVFEALNVRTAYRELADRGVRFENELRPVMSTAGKDLLAAHFRDPDGHYGSLTGWVASEADAG